MLTTVNNYLFFLTVKSGTTSQKDKIIWILQISSQLEMLLFISRLLFAFIFTINIFLILRGRIFSGVGVVLRLRTNTVRTEHRTFLNSQNVRVMTKPRLEYKDSRRITINVLTPTLYILHYTYIRTCTVRYV